MDKNQYAIKCGVCGTEFYILDPACPNCRAKGQSWLFKYFSQSETCRWLTLFITAIYSIPSVVAMIFLFTCEIMAITSSFMLVLAVFLTPLSLIESIFRWEWTTGELVSVGIDSFGYYILFMILSSPLIIISSLIENIFGEESHIIGNSFTSTKNYFKYSLIAIIPFFYFKRKIQISRRRMVYKASYEIININNANCGIINEIYKMFTYKAHKKIFYIKNAVSEIISIYNRCSSEDFKLIEKTNILKYLYLFCLKSHQKEYLSRKNVEWLSSQKELFDDVENIPNFLAVLPKEELETKYALILDSCILFFLSNTIAIISWILMIYCLFKLNLIHWQ